VNKGKNKGRSYCATTLKACSAFGRLPPLPSIGRHNHYLTPSARPWGEEAGDRQVHGNLPQIRMFE
jgi:hypothetical protein